jgi:hypothetical protein
LVAYLSVDNCHSNTKQEARNQEARNQEARKQEARKQEERKQGSKKQGSKNQGSKKVSSCLEDLKATPHHPVYHTEPPQTTGLRSVLLP